MREAIIEHVGDVSSLEGKVQRIHDASGMELRLWSCGAEVGQLEGPKVGRQGG